MSTPDRAAPPTGDAEPPTAASLPGEDVWAEEFTGERLIVERTGAVLVQTLERADSARTRFFGLMMRRELPAGHGLWLAPCSSIHMMFMRFAIDVVWLDSQNVVRKVSSNVAPWIGMAGCWSAVAALELPAGAAAGLVTGDRLRLA